MRCGIGCRVVQHGSEVAVQRIYPNGAIHASGKIAVGDTLVEIDGEKVEDVSTAKNLLAGDCGSLITLKIRRGGVAGGDIESVLMLREDGQDIDGFGEEDVLGIAAALHLVRVGVHVDQIIPGGPAWCSGVISKGSIITAIDGVNVVGGNLHPSEITAMIRGAVGTRVSLEIKSDGAASRSSTVDLVRLWTLQPEDVRSYRARLQQCVSMHGVGRDQRAPQAQHVIPRDLSQYSPSSPNAWEGLDSGINRRSKDESLRSAAPLGSGARERFVNFLQSIEDLRRRMDREEEEMAGRYSLLTEDLEALGRTMDGLGAVVQSSMRPGRSP